MSPEKAASNDEREATGGGDRRPTTSARRSTRRYIFRNFSILKGQKKVFPKFSAFMRKSAGLRAPLLAKNEKKWKMNRIDAGNFSRRFVGFQNRRASSRRNASRAVGFRLVGRRPKLRFPTATPFRTVVARRRRGENRRRAARREKPRRAKRVFRRREQKRS